MKKSLRGHRLCGEENCDVEIIADEKYCAGHKWQIDIWLKKSKELLAHLIHSQMKG